MGFGDRSFKAQMREANNRGARFVVLIGESEIAGGTAQVKSMKDGSQTEVRWDGLAGHIRNQEAVPVNGPADRTPSGPFVFLVLLGTFLAYIALSLAFGGSASKPAILLLEALLIAPALVSVVIGKYPFRGAFRTGRAPVKVLILCVFLGIGLGIVSDELDRMAQSAYPMPEEILDSLKKFMVFHSTGELIFLIFTVVIFAGVFEEMLFRGFLQTALERAGRPAKAVVLSAAVFAILHFNPWWMLQIFGLGIALGVMAWRSRSIWPGVVIHMTNNAVSLVFINTDESKLRGYEFRGQVAPLWMAVGLVFTVVGFKLFYRMTEPPGEDPAMKRGLQ
jgi:membrane protease YdiL (CAAX protease family)